MAETSL